MEKNDIYQILSLIISGLTLWITYQDNKAKEKALTTKRKKRTRK